jgi:hypothetical protein
MIYGVEINVIPQDMPLHGQKKRLSAAFKTLEKVCAAEPHKTLAGAGKVLQDFRLDRSRRFMRSLGDIVAKAISRQGKPVNGINGIRRIETGVLIGRIAVIDFELHCPGLSIREI